MIFYETPQGKPVESFSHTQYALSKFCPRKYILMRHFGWRQWPPPANLEFGKCVEAAVRAFYEAGTPPELSFPARWEKFKDTKLDYTDDDKDWSHLDSVGRELMRVFVAIAGSLGISQPKFYDYQSRLKKDFLPGSHLDCIPDFIDWPTPHPKWGEGARLVDIKTSAKSYPTEPEGLAAQDEQLRVQSWVTGIERVAFLVFIKSGTELAQRKGRQATLLADIHGLARLGRSVTLAESPEDKKWAKELKAGGLFLVDLGNSVPRPLRIVTVAASMLSGARIQLIEARVDSGEALATVNLVAEEARQVANRWESFRATPALSYIAADIDREDTTLIRSYPQQPGMRFPDDKCSWCPMLGLCLKRPDLVKDRIIQVGEEWLEE